MFTSLYSHWPPNIAIVKGPLSTGILLPADFTICLEVLQLTNHESHTNSVQS